MPIHPPFSDTLLLQTWLRGACYITYANCGMTGPHLEGYQIKILRSLFLMVFGPFAGSQQVNGTSEPSGEGHLGNCFTNPYRKLVRSSAQGVALGVNTRQLFSRRPRGSDLMRDRFRDAVILLARCSRQHRDGRANRGALRSIVSF